VSRDGTIDFAGGFILRIDPDGIVRMTANAGSNCTFSGDGGDALKASVCQAWDVLRDSSGNVLIADTNDNRIRRVDRKTGIIATIAGSGPVNGLEHYGAGTTCGDGGPATSACINTPYGLTFDDRGNLYVSEASGIRKIDSGGVITTFAAVRCNKITWAFGSLFAVAGDFVARVSRTGQVTSLTSHGIGFDGDGGPATAAHIFALKQSHGIAVDGEANVFFVAPPNASIQASSSGPTIRATVFDAGGHPAEGVRVDFAAPLSGLSCHFSNNGSTIGVVTDSNGVAATTCVPNCAGSGSFVVSMQPLSSTATASLTMRDISGPCRRRSVGH
jgi:hypothetical protein